MAGYYNPNFGQDYLASRGIGPQMLNTNERSPVAPPASSQEGVKPINSWSDAFDSIAKPYTDKYDSIKKTASNLSDAASQLGQGNVLGAFNAARGATPAAAAADTATEAFPGAVDFTKSVTGLSGDGIVSSIGDALSGGMDALATLFV